MLNADSVEDVIVRFRDVRKDYRGCAALNGVSLEIRAGEAVAVAGPSGSGKSTLLNLVAGLDRATSGSVVVDDVDLATLSDRGLAQFRRTRVGIIFQFPVLLEDLSALDNVMLAARLAGAGAAHARRSALELFGELGIAAHRDSYPSRLSSGQRQRVAVARALVNDPDLLLADEPTGALDSRAGAGMMELLIELHGWGHTLLLATHDERLVAHCATRVVDVADGRIVRERARELAS